MAYFWLGVSLFFALWWYPRASEAACAGERFLPNRVIALVDQREETSFETSRIARHLAGPLAQKGLFPLYVDVASPLPATFDRAPIAGVLSWFSSDVPAPQGVADWLAAKERECGRALPHVAIGELGGAPLWHQFGVDRARAAILHDGARDKIETARGWRSLEGLLEVPPGLVVAPVVPSGGVPIVRMSANDGAPRVLGFQRGIQTWLSDQLLADRAEGTAAAVDLARVFLSYTGTGPTPVPDLAMFQGRRIALSMLLAEGWQLRAPPSGGASLGIPVYAFARQIFEAEGAPVTFGWPEPSPQELSDEPGAAAAASALKKARHVHSLPLTKADGFLSFGSPVVLRLLSASQGGWGASPLPDQVAVAPLIGPSGFGDPTGLYARATAVARSERPWPFAPDTLVVRAQDLLTETGRAAVIQVRALHTSKDRAAMSVVQYAELLKGAVSTQIEPLGSHVWRIANRGALHTVRFDRPGSLALDMGRSMGVLGSWWLGSALFIALDPAIETPVIALGPKHSITDVALQAIELVEAGPKLERVHRDGCRTTALVEGSGQITVRALLKPDIRLAQDRLPVFSSGPNLWQFMVPDHLATSRGLTLMVGCP